MVDGKRSRVERCNIHTVWERIQIAFNDFESKGLISRDIQRSLDADSLVPAIVGYVTTFAARKGISDIGNAVESILTNGNKYLSSKNITYNEAIREKMALITSIGEEV
jgi:hypothetical protein